MATRDAPRVAVNHSHTSTTVAPAGHPRLPSPRARTTAREPEPPARPHGDTATHRPGKSSPDSLLRCDATAQRAESPDPMLCIKKHVSLVNIMPTTVVPPSTLGESVFLMTPGPCQSVPFASFLLENVIKSGDEGYRFYSTAQMRSGLGFVCLHKHGFTTELPRML